LLAFLLVCIACTLAPFDGAFLAGRARPSLRVRGRVARTTEEQLSGSSLTPSLVPAAAASSDPGDGPEGDWVECTIGYTPTVSVARGVVEPRREDTYLFHKMHLQEQFGHLYAKLGFTLQGGLLYKDVQTVCREPDNLDGVCSDCFKFIFGGSIGFVGITSPRFYGRDDVTVEECIGDSAELKAQEEAMPEDRFRPETSIWCMKNS